MKRILTTIIALAAATVTFGAEWYVDPVNGLDTRDGTTSNVVSETVGPRKTLEYAMKLVNAGDTSDGALVYLRPETSSFWHTATNSTMTLPVDFPVGASSATLTVTGSFGYSVTIDDITSPSVTVTLPEATMPENAPATEDVYDFMLTFDDGTVRTAKLGLTAGLGDGEGQTRCLSPVSCTAWEKANGQVAIPIPFGMTSFSVDGVPTDTGLDGAQGWYALKLKSNVAASLSALVGEVEWQALLRGAVAGLFIILR